MATAPPPSGRWLFGPAPDLLLGCGLLYVLVIAVYALGGSAVRASEAPYLFPLLILLFSTPHYGATLLRVYEQRSSRRAYTLFAVHATLLVVGAFVAGLYSSMVAAWMLTIYFTWSPWHYTGQNYGLAVMFLRRRGVPVTPTVKRFVYATFILSYALVFVMIHASSGANVDAPLVNYRGSNIHFRPLGLSAGLVDVLATGILLAYGLALVGTGGLLLRRSSWRDLVPTSMLVLTQALWFSIPFSVRVLGVSTGLDPLDWQLREHYLNWVVFGHAVQYLWVTTYYARATEAWSGYASYLGKTLLAGVALWTLPVVLIAATGVGELPYWLGLGLLATAAINIHHFILDGAIWKLRNTRIANVLVRSESAEAESPALGEGARVPWLRRGVWAIAAAGTAIGVFCFWQKDVVAPAAMARRDFAGARAALDRLAWFGRDNPVVRRVLVRAESEYDARLAEMEAEFGARPSVTQSLALGRLYEEQGALADALRAYEKALAVDAGGSPELLYRAGSVALRMGRREQAEPLLERAVLLRPWHEPSRRELELARRSPEGAGSPSY